MNKIFFSIIIPCYNIELYISKTLDCVLEQTFKNFEVILINDGSTDKTGKILDEYKIKDTRIRVIHKKNEGVSKTRNLGIEKSRGKYIYFLDGDDLIEKNLLEKAYSILENKSVKMFSFGYDTKDNMNSRNYVAEKFSKKIFTSKEFLNYFLKKEISQSICSFITKKEFFDKLEFDCDLVDGEDLDFQMKLLLRNNFNLYYDSDIYFHYIRREDSATKKLFSLKALKTLDSLKILRKEMLNNGIDIFKDYHIIRFFYMIKCLGKNGYLKSDYEMIKNNFKNYDYILKDLKLEFNKKSIMLNVLKLFYKINFKLLILIFKATD